MEKKKKNLLIVVFLLLLLCATYLIIVLPGKKKVIKPFNMLITHTDERYGFSISYPKIIKSETIFQKYYFLTDLWMAGAQTDSTGIPLLSIPLYRVSNDKSYPRYWDVEVRIGVTTDSNELQTFLSKSAFTNAPPEQKIINGVTFYKFPIQDAGMMQFVAGFSYRTIHNGVGYAIEQIKTGSNYREDKSPKDISDKILDDYFNQTNAIVNSFQFIDTWEKK
jgi:hypothetical protein